MGLPRRMWAGGALTFHAPLLAGVAAEKQSSVLKAERKAGRTGPLGFVTLEHQIWQGDTLCITDRQDLVYREDPSPFAPSPEPPMANTDEDSAIDAQFDSTLLFRYSALTFNGHRIHYDLDYARQVEGYGGLVVHGPLLAQGLLLMASEQAPVRGFRFRATAPLMHDEVATLCRTGPEMWVRGPDGRQCMTATVEV
jgi:3-methylfumaryl-CoA hydratase